MREATRIQLCGRLVVELDGRRVEDALPGAKGRLLFAYLVLNRDRRMSRDELLTAVYGEDASPDQHPSLSVLLSKLRSVIGRELLAGRSEIELVLPRDTFVDVEAAREALHRAESHVAAGEWAESWGPAGVAYHVARRPLLQGEDRRWLEEWRRRLEEVHLRGLECFAEARLGLGGPTLSQAEDCARQHQEEVTPKAASMKAGRTAAGTFGRCGVRRRRDRDFTGSGISSAPTNAIANKTNAAT